MYKGYSSEFRNSLPIHWTPISPPWKLNDLNEHHVFLD